MTANPKLSRRNFLKLPGVTGALVLGFRLPETSHAADADRLSVMNMARADEAFKPNLYVQIDPDGIITITVHRSEMGQGVNTSVPMIVAEELDADWSMIRTVQAPPDPRYGNQMTGGSQSMSSSYLILRVAGGTVRQLMINAAAQVWEVDPTTLRTEPSRVINAASGDSLGYGELVEVAATLPVPDRDIALKDPADFRLIGHDMPHLDNPDMVAGRATYCSDLQFEGMLVAVVARCPEFSGQVTAFDASGAEAIPGVRHVIQFADDKVAVVADDTFTALKGRDALTVTWEPGRNADLTTESIRQSLADRVALSGEDNILEAVYEIPFLAHVPMEPMTCAADVREDRAKVWAPTQDRQAALAVVRSVTKLPQDAVTLHVPLMGGAFGRRLQLDFVREAVLISREIGAPVKVFWTRTNDIQHDFYHPASLTHESVQLEPLGRIQDRRTQSNAIPTGSWRSVGNFTAAFPQQSFVDEVAAALQIDPLVCRLEIENDSRRAVLELCAEKAGWGDPLPEGIGRGMAVFSTFGVTHVAMIADVSVDESDQVHVHRIVCAVDCGTVVNPDTVKAQIEGGIVFGLSAVLYGEITVRGGAVQQSNFHDYPILRFDAMPQIEVHILPSDSSPTGIGEMGVPPVAPAVSNAIFAATGKRLRKLPFTPDALRSAP